MDTALEQEKPARQFPWKPLGTLVFVLFLAVGIGGTYNYLNNHNPDALKQITLKLDRLGLTPENPVEIQRVSNINKLSISYEEKQILINKTIFLGATPRMVMLALGQPQEGHRTNDDLESKKTVILVYHLPEELRPTMLKFDEGKLTHAYKGSTIDFDTTPVPYTGTNSE